MYPFCIGSLNHKFRAKLLIVDMKAGYSECCAASVGALSYQSAHLGGLLGSRIYCPPKWVYLSRVTACMYILPTYVHVEPWLQINSHWSFVMGLED
jgi:hypothetical protein